MQNVLRSDDSEFQSYLTDLSASLEKSVAESSQVYGELTAKIIDKENQEYFLQWPELLQLFTAIGAQTLTIRGSEKSMYGKFFEKLVLGSLLSVLGFKLKDDPSITKKTFWLSQREDKRESDATLIVEPGIGVRFDIGFIGPGNTEISLDKVSRFEREIEMGRQKYYMSTIILVDRIGERSRIVDMAKNIDGTIIQMSMSNWVKEVATVLKQKTNYKAEILSLSDDDCKEYIEKKLKNIDLHLFI
nr:CfrBI family restriction endonuclease [Treponema brennaborense]